MVVPFAHITESHDPTIARFNKTPTTQILQFLYWHDKLKIYLFPGWNNKRAQNLAFQRKLSKCNNVDLEIKSTYMVDLFLVFVVYKIYSLDCQLCHFVAYNLELHYLSANTSQT